MAATIGTSDEGSLNIEINVVPFIDLFSCLTAFLLVTAVWTNLAQIKIKPKGIGQESNEQLQEEEWVKVSVLLAEQEIWVGMSRVQDFRRIEKGATGDYDWAKLRETLQEHRESSFLAPPNPYFQSIEIGAEDQVVYQDVISAMDYAIAVGFKDVGLSDPAALSARPTF